MATLAIKNGRNFIRLGAGAGYSGDRIDPAVELVEKADLDYLVFECLGERTIALAQADKLQAPSRGYDPLLRERMEAVLRQCAARGIKIITNMGAANPKACAEETARICCELGLPDIRIAYVLGDDLYERLRSGALDLEAQTLAVPSGDIVSVNAYLGAGPIVEALSRGADVIVTGRVGDPSMFLAPLIFEFGWSFADWSLLGKGTLVGHLLECAGQVTGGFFAEPQYKDVSGLAWLGFPFAEVDGNGDATICKVEGSGGCISLATCKEQLLYEVHDPAAYLQPDVIADFSGAQLVELGDNKVRVSGGNGHPRTGKLKVSIGYRDGFIGEGQISYGGPGARARGELAIRIVEERLKVLAPDLTEIRSDLVGMNSLYGGRPDSEPSEVRVRVAGRSRDWRAARRIGEEVESLYTNGPAGGGGAWKSTREVLAVASGLIGADRVQTSVHFVESRHASS